MKHKSFQNILLSLALLICLLPISSCGDDDQDYLFEVDYAFTITVPTGQNPALSLVFPFEHLASQIVQQLSSRGLTEADITSIHTTRSRLDLLGFDGDFSDLQEAIVNVYLGPNPSANPFEAAYTIEIRDRFTDQLDIVPSLTNLKEVLTKDFFNMELVLTQRRTIVVPMEARFSITFGVIQ